MKALQQSPKSTTISGSARQFRELINSLRQQQMNCKAAQTDDMVRPSQRNEAQEGKTLSQMNNFIQKEEDKGLQLKTKTIVGGRDSLKKRPLIFDNNPEVIHTPPKQVSIQIIPQKSLQLIHSRLSPTKNASTQCQLPSHELGSSFLSPPSISPVRAGQIIKQHLPNQNQLLALNFHNMPNIHNLEDRLVMEYFAKQKIIVPSSEPSQIFSFFTNLCLACNIVIYSPTIKKFKNCVYFGHPISAQTYEGFLYFYDNKLYYGQFKNGLRHGMGVELHLAESTKYKEQFKEGRKSGKFFIERLTQKYVGFIQNGLYQGEGKLTTEDCIYQGCFDRGLKNGYGEEIYPKTGIKITGHFRNGVLEKTKQAKSIPEIRGKHKIRAHSGQKDVGIERLGMVRRKSLEKHNQRMNKIRQKSLYEMQLGGREDYFEPPQQARTFKANDKLEVYRQPLQKLPRICQDFEVSFDTVHNMDSISNHSHHPKHQPRQQQQYQQPMFQQRMETGQFQQPLPTPCLTILRGRR